VAIKVRVTARDFISGENRMFLEIYEDADSFEIIFDETKQLAHLCVYEEENLIACFPPGFWFGVEKVKE
jgi:hypothetical protein